ncbi:MAG TPA: 16S rRNA (cytosine(967)-C(5))-methyltransferase RsmB [Nitrospiraceae bacterium]|nr:16S rRNA (cytosine(967)-C(5))-methyltransferase RsmB [Nitrospiraceae bacterium]
MSSIGTRHITSRAVSPARFAALSVLLSCHTAGDIDDLLHQACEASVSDPRDRALAMELVYGVLRRQETIDWRLGPLLKKPVPRLPFVLQMLLRLGAYQLLYLDRVPPSAAVHETVALTKLHTNKLGRDWSGFVNAVLRNLIRLPEPPLPDPQSDPAQALSIRYAVPLWLCQRWVSRLGFEQAEAACRSTSCIPPVTIRVNHRRSTREALLNRLRQQGISASPTTISPAGITLEKGQIVTALPGFREGEFYIEDEAAQIIPPLLDPQPGDLILDACAAPGGKTTHLAELMEDSGSILAMDRQKARLDLLHENCRRLGITIVTTIVGDARKPLEALRASYTGRGTTSRSTKVSGGFVDRVLLDAPCSGLGVLRRHPEAKWNKHTAMFIRHHNLQKEILEAVSAVLRPGGVLVYSTCSTEPEETEDVVTHFCHVHAGWMRESVAPWLPSPALPFVTAHGALSTMGNECGMDSFYAARLRKVS